MKAARLLLIVSVVGFVLYICALVGGVLALTFVPAAREAVAPVICPDGWALTTESYTCTDEDGTGTCVDFLCESPAGDTRDISGLFVLAIFIAVGPLTICPFPIIILFVLLALRNRQSQTVTMMPQSPVMGAVVTGGRQITIQGRDGPFVVRFQDDSLPLDEKIAILENAHDNGQLTDQQLSEAIEEVTRREEWGE